MLFLYLIGKKLESLLLANTFLVLFTFESAQIYLILVILFSVLWSQTKQFLHLKFIVLTSLKNQPDIAY